MHYTVAGRGEKGRKEDRDIEGKEQFLFFLPLYFLCFIYFFFLLLYIIRYISKTIKLTHLEVSLNDL